MIGRQKVAALLPAYQEERAIADVVRRVRKELDHVLVIDDGSTDNTSGQARAAGADLIRHDSNRGKGAAIKTGLAQLLKREFSHILLLDADGQHRPEEIPVFLQAAGETGAQLLLGNRMGDSGNMPFVRRLVNRYMSWRISRLCRQRIPDSQCGFRMLHRDLARELFCQSDAYDFESEMLFIAAAKGIRIASVPVSTLYGDEVSKIRPLRDTARFFALLARYKK